MLYKYCIATRVMMIIIVCVFFLSFTIYLLQITNEEIMLCWIGLLLRCYSFSTSPVILTINHSICIGSFCIYLLVTYLLGIMI